MHIIKDQRFISVVTGLIVALSIWLKPTTEFVPTKGEVEEEIYKALPEVRYEPEQSPPAGNVVLTLVGQANKILSRRIQIKINGEFLNPKEWTVQEQSGFVEGITIPGSCFQTFSRGNNKTTCIEVVYDGMAWYQKNVVVNLGSTALSAITPSKF